MRERTITATALGATLIVLAACVIGEHDVEAADVSLWTETTAPDIERAFTVVEWDTILKIGAGAEDTVLMLPYHMAVTRSGIYVFDAGPNRLHRFDHGGALLWSLGRRGSGPDEFEQVRDLKVDGEDRAVVLDTENARLTIVERNGRIARRVDLRNAGAVEEVVPLPGGRFVLLRIFSPENPLVYADSAGAVLREAPVPWDDYRRLNPLQGQGHLSIGSDGRWVFGLSAGNGWFAFDDAEHRYTAAYAEHSPFPGIRTVVDGDRRITRTERGIATASTITVLDSTVAVLFGGRPGMRQRIVDVFRWEDGTYLESYRLPRPAVAAQVDGSAVYLLAHSPYPHILVLKPRSASPESSPEPE